MSAVSLEFGYHPHDLVLSSGLISSSRLPDHAQTVADMAVASGIEGDWIYAPPQQVRDFMSGTISERPYASRVFGLPKTHTITHADADSPDHVEFLVWALSFFTGMRLTTAEAGYLDATPVRPGKLVDFIVLGGLDAPMALAEAFWVGNRHEPSRARLVAAAIHALFLAQGPQLLQFERFIYAYTALDACFALAVSAAPPAGRVSHADRIRWLCDRFGMETPDWAMPATGGSQVAGIRNATMHEALYFGEPLGFALHGVGTNQNLTLEMKALIGRLIVALLGAPQADYVTARVNTRQIQGLRIG